MTTNGIDALAGADCSLETLLSRYFARISQLHGHCFYDANFNPQTERRTREPPTTSRTPSAWPKERRYEEMLFLAAAVLLMVLAGDSTQIGSSDAIPVDPASGAVTFSGALQDPKITTAPCPSAEVRTHH